MVPYEERQSSDILFYLFLLCIVFALLLLATAPAHDGRQHAIERHGSDAITNMNCYDNGNVFVTLFNFATGRCVHIVKRPDDRYGAVVTGQDGGIITAFGRWAEKAAADFFATIIGRGGMP